MNWGFRKVLDDIRICSNREIKKNKQFYQYLRKTQFA